MAGKQSVTDVAVAIQRTTGLMWWFGAVSTAISAGVLVPLVVLSTRTADFFAWTIAVPASAQFMGVFYLMAATMGVLALRQPLWAPARAALVPVVVFVGIVTLVTLAHLDAFHLAEGSFPARAMAWIWLGIYVATPVGYVFAFRYQARAGGMEPPRTVALAVPTRWALIAVAVLGCAAGVALLVAPMAVAPVWPWPLTALTARMTGATLVGVGLLAGSVARVDDGFTGRIAAVGLVVGGVAAGVVGLGAIPLSDSSVWLYLAVCALLAGLGAMGLSAQGSPIDVPRPGSRQ